MDDLMFDEWEILFHRPNNHEGGTATYAGASIESLTNMWFGYPNKVLHKKHEGFNQETYKQLTKNPALLNKLNDNGYTDTNGNVKWVSYSYNNYGFRSDSWLDNEKGVVCLGCSDTFGVGNYLEDTWPYIVSKHLGVKTFNLGYPGGGVDQAYRVLKSHISTINADYVLMLTPEITRREMFKDGEPILVNIGAFNTHLKESFVNEEKLFDELSSVYKKLLTQYHYSFINSSMALDAIKYLCKKYGKKFIELKNPPYYPDDISAEIENEYKSNPSLALDLVHRGRTFQHLIAKYFIKKL